MKTESIGSSREEIVRWIPTLTAAELAVARRYYQEHQAELDEEDKRVGAYVAEQVRPQRRRHQAAGQHLRRPRLSTGSPAWRGPARVLLALDLSIH